jgi:hypothetical protein
LGMGRRPKTFGIDFGLWTRRDHPELHAELSLIGGFVTICNRNFQRATVATDHRSQTQKLHS